MKTQRTVPLASLLLILIFVSVFGIAGSTEAQKVHALLILLGNDVDIQESVEKNKQKMVNMLKQLSHHCNVQLTLMHSESVNEGTVSHQTFVKGRSDKPTTDEQDIIESRQVLEWLRNLAPASEDTVLIYYNGHGKIDAYGTHTLIYDHGLNHDTPDRGKLSEILKAQPARLRLLITDTCSNLSEDLSDDTFARFAAQVRRKARPYMQNLFLEHEGFLDITAASPGQFAIGNNDLGGHFTSALLSQGFTAVADRDGDGDSFLSWQEVFDTTVAQTKKLYQEATFGRSMEAELQKQGQTTQEPLAHSLPERTGGGSPLVQAPPPIRAVTVLNFTSDPPGAEVSIDGFVVGRTPLTDYELDTDGGSTKEIEVTVKAEGYRDAVKKFRVQRGKPFAWNFTLTIKDPIYLEQFILKDSELSEGDRLVDLSEEEEGPCGMNSNPYLSLDRQFINCIVPMIFESLEVEVSVAEIESLVAAIHAILYVVYAEYSDEYGIVGLQFNSEKSAQRTNDLLKNRMGTKAYIKGKVVIWVWCDTPGDYSKLEGLVKTRLRNLK